MHSFGPVALLSSRAGTILSKIPLSFFRSNSPSFGISSFGIAIVVGSTHGCVHDKEVVPKEAPLSDRSLKGTPWVALDALWAA